MKISPLMFVRPEKLRTNESVKLTENFMFYPSQFVLHAQLRVDCRMLLCR